MKTLRVLAICAFAVLIGSSVVQAQLLVDYTGGNVLMDDSQTWDDAAIGTSTVVPTTFFGDSFTSFSVTSNGKIAAIGDTGGGNTSLPDSARVASIAPLWDDMIISQGNGGKVVEKTDTTESYYAVTWVNMESFPSSNGRQTFQTVLFGSPVNLQGFDFLAGDIVFSYGNIDAPFADAGNLGATVGLDKGDGTTYAALLGSGNGLITDRSQLPLDTGAFVLFRADGQGGYITSVQHINPVPSPQSFLTMLLGCILMLVRLITRQT